MMESSSLILLNMSFKIVLGKIRLGTEYMTSLSNRSSMPQGWRSKTTALLLKGSVRIDVGMSLVFFTGGMCLGYVVFWCWSFFVGGCRVCCILLPYQRLERIVD